MEDPDISSEIEFEGLLKEIVQSARENSVNVRGGYSVPLEDHNYDLGVEIYRVE